jgi:hypothetical protein
MNMFGVPKYAIIQRRSYRILSVDKLVDVSHEVSDGVGISFMDLFEELDVGDSLVVGDDVLIFDTREGVAVLEVAVGVLPKGFVASYPHSDEVVSVIGSVVGRLVVGHEESGQGGLGSDALYWVIVEPQEWCISHHKGEVSRHVVFVASRCTCCDVVHLEPYTWVRATVIFLNGWLESLGQGSLR